MDLRATLIILLGIALALLIPIVLYVGMRKDKSTIHFDLFRKAAEQSRRPWKNEEDDMAKLSRMVAELKEKNPPLRGEDQGDGEGENRNSNG